MALKSTIIVTLASIVLMKCFSVNCSECPEDVPCPSWPVACQDGTVTVNRKAYSLANTEHLCDGCPVCIDPEQQECPSLPIKRREAPEALIDPSGCENHTFYEFTVEAANGQICYGGYSFTCGKRRSLI